VLRIENRVLHILKAILDNFPWLVWIGGGELLGNYYSRENENSALIEF
jgi:hypothetical protein